MGFVYILRCRDGTLYTGATKDLEARLAAHLSGRASKYTRSRLPVAIVFWKKLSSWRRALREERRIKGLDRSQKLALLVDQAGVPPPRRRGRLDKGRGSGP